MLPLQRTPPSLTLCDTPSRRAPRLASGQRLLTAMLAPCLADRSFVSKITDYKASAPIGELELGVRKLLQLYVEPPGSGLTWSLRTRKSAPCSALHSACDG